ncbi:MAG: hypothetical protein J0L75_15395 [Spirochaetes bacterium]|nr:hypothetical protein [Spirochaetota bacterium]
MNAKNDLPREDLELLDVLVALRRHWRRLLVATAVLYVAFYGIAWILFPRGRTEATWRVEIPVRVTLPFDYRAQAELNLPKVAFPGGLRWQTIVDGASLKGTLSWSGKIEGSGALREDAKRAERVLQETIAAGFFTVNLLSAYTYAGMDPIPVLRQRLETARVEGEALRLKLAADPAATEVLKQSANLQSWIASLQVLVAQRQTYDLRVDEWARAKALLYATPPEGWSNLSFSAFPLTGAQTAETVAQIQKYLAPPYLVVGEPRIDRSEITPVKKLPMMGFVFIALFVAFLLVIAPLWLERSKSGRAGGA